MPNAPPYIVHHPYNQRSKYTARWRQSMGSRSRRVCGLPCTRSGSSQVDYHEKLCDADSGVQCGGIIQQQQKLHIHLSAHTCIHLERSITTSLWKSHRNIIKHTYKNTSNMCSINICICTRNRVKCPRRCHAIAWCRAVAFCLVNYVCT